MLQILTDLTMSDHLSESVSSVFHSHESFCWIFEVANIIILCELQGWIDGESRGQCLKELEEIARMITGFSRSL